MRALTKGDEVAAIFQGGSPAIFAHFLEIERVFEQAGAQSTRTAGFAHQGFRAPSKDRDLRATAEAQ